MCVLCLGKFQICHDDVIMAKEACRYVEWYCDSNKTRGSKSKPCSIIKTVSTSTIAYAIQTIWERKKKTFPDLDKHDGFSCQPPFFFRSSSSLLAIANIVLFYQLLDLPDSVSASMVPLERMNSGGVKVNQPGTKLYQPMAPALMGQ